MNTSEAVREALLTYEGDPATAPSDRIVAIARAKLGQNGAAKNLTSNMVAKIKYVITAKLGKPLTKDKIGKYSQSPHANRRNGAVQLPPGKGAVLVKVPNNLLNFDLAALKKAKEFAKECGGIDPALYLLQALKDLSS